MSHIRLAVGQSVLFLLGASALNAQDLSELCPNSSADTGALVGIVSDLEAEMALPGATVLATWEKDGIPGRAETQTGLDGSFTMCHLPLETDLSVQAMFATMAGQAVPLSLAESITHQDIGFSLTGGGASTGGEDDRMWACIGRPDSQMRIQLGRLVRCDANWQPLEQCPREELGTVSASAGSRGRGAMREMIDRLIDEAERLGANALVEVSGGRGTMTAQAVQIDVDPGTC